MEKGVYELQETGKDKQLTRKCFYGPSDVTIEARCMDPFKSNVSAQWNITDNGCWSIYGPYEHFETSELAQVKIRTCFRISMTIESHLNREKSVFNFSFSST